MHQRITYLLPEGTGIDPADIELTDSELKYRKVADAAEERRITLGLSELPKELQTFFNDFHELHVRVASPHRHDSFLPAVSRLPPGLHAFFTPRKPNGKVCSQLKRLIGEDIKCTDSLNSFSKPHVLSERFASSSTYQSYYEPHSMAKIYQNLKTHICPSLSETNPLRELCSTIANAVPATYIDLDFDVISHAVTITMFWNPPEPGNKDSRLPAIRRPQTSDRLEVGILQPENPEEPEELSLGGYLTVIGEDDHPSPTLFSFPARHHPLPLSDPTTYTTHFNPPTGLHPTLNITFPLHPSSPPNPTCALHAYLTLPSALFIDRYPLQDPLFLASQNLKALRSLSGAQDLEAPDWAVPQWGSAALLELSHTSGGGSITIPTHLRYVNGSSSGGSVEVPWPVVFWACEAEEGLKMGTNPFDRVNLGFEGLFGPKTMFYYVPPAGNVLIERIVPPRMDEEWTEWVPVGTMVVVMVGFAWVCWKILSGGKAVSVERMGEEKKER